ncbi:Ni-sirohydrochlorin a,c-diamide reductive cyclase complex, component CfbC [Methanogenium sp. MK-MG]|nr:Ni-sirohydrochlorin a,c-diamide reductive cyclase complex, component CfbC [Methanogenium sp. MK-MG]
MIAYIPRANIVQVAEVNQRTVIEYAPESDQAEVYRQLARTIMENTTLTIPTPLEMHELEELARSHLKV